MLYTVKLVDWVLFFKSKICLLRIFHKKKCLGFEKTFQTIYYK